MGLKTIYLNNINLDDDSFDNEDLELLFILNLNFMAWSNRYKQRKTCKNKISKKLMPVAWHPTRWWDWCVLEDGKTE